MTQDSLVDRSAVSGWRARKRLPVDSAESSGGMRNGFRGDRPSRNRLPCPRSGCPAVPAVQPRHLIDGASVRTASERAKEACREADRLACEAWNALDVVRRPKTTLITSLSATCGAGTVRTRGAIWWPCGLCGARLFFARKGRLGMRQCPSTPPMRG